MIEAGHIDNVRLYSGDAADLLSWLPDASVAKVDLLYPDPWPKRRHWKRRFVQDRTVAMLARVLRPGGLFRFATDIPDYAAWTLERLLRASSFVWTAERADDCQRQNQDAGEDGSLDGNCGEPLHDGYPSICTRAPSFPETS